MGWTAVPLPPLAEGDNRNIGAAHASAQQSRQTQCPIAVIGIDIGKNVFHLIGLDKCGAIVLKAKFSRGQLENRLANLPPCLIGMEAGVGSHYLSRRLMALGHDARLMPAQYVKPFLKGHKNDYRDAEAVAEAVLGKISKRGNKYLRMLFVQAARVVLLKRVSWERYGLKSWIEAAAKRLHHNKLAIALANKLARIAWAVLHHGRNFEVSHEYTPQPA